MYHERYVMGGGYDVAERSTWSIRLMPVLRTIVVWRTRDGRRRLIRLYKAWRNLNDRIQGHVKTGRGGVPIWAGLECGFAGWPEFRAWALANGFSRTRCSLDRIRSREGYIPSNLRWVTPLENSTFANLIGAKKRKQLSQRAARAA
jgi:hypothetical protein